MYQYDESIFYHLSGLKLMLHKNLSDAEIFTHSRFLGIKAEFVFLELNV